MKKVFIIMLAMTFNLQASEKLYANEPKDTVMVNLLSLSAEPIAALNKSDIECRTAKWIISDKNILNKLRALLSEGEKSNFREMALRGKFNFDSDIYYIDEYAHVSHNGSSYQIDKTAFMDFAKKSFTRQNVVQLPYTACQ